MDRYEGTGRTRDDRAPIGIAQLLLRLVVQPRTGTWDVTQQGLPNGGRSAVNRGDSG